MKICANPDCEKEFEPKVHNAIYCGSDCRKLITNQKVLDNYYKNKERKDSKRTCPTENCGTVLSIYNKEDICELCQTKRLQDRLISWGWDEDKVREEWSY